MAMEFVEKNFPNDVSKETVEYYRNYIAVSMIEVKPHLKFSQWGAGGRILFVVLLTYR